MITNECSCINITVNPSLSLGLGSERQANKASHGHRLFSPTISSGSRNSLPQRSPRNGLVLFSMTWRFQTRDYKHVGFTFVMGDERPDHGDAGKLSVRSSS